MCRFFLERLVSFGKGFRAEVKSLSRFALSRRAAGRDRKLSLDWRERCTVAMKRGERKRERRLQTMSSSVASTAEEATAALVVCQSVQHCELTTHLLLETFLFYRRIFALALAISFFSVAEAKALPVQALSFFLSFFLCLSCFLVFPIALFRPSNFFFWLPCKLCTRILSCPRPLLSPKNILSKNNSK